MLGVGEGDGGATVGLGVAGTGVGDGVGATVGAGPVADGVGDWKLGVGEPGIVGLGLAAGEPHAATRTTIKSAATDGRRNMRGPPKGIHPPSGSTRDRSPASAGRHEVSGRQAQEEISARSGVTARTPVDRRIGG